MGVEFNRKSAQPVLVLLQRASSLPPAPQSADAPPGVFKGVFYKDCLDHMMKE